MAVLTTVLVGGGLLITGVAAAKHFFWGNKGKENNAENLNNLKREQQKRYAEMPKQAKAATSRTAKQSNQILEKAMKINSAIQKSAKALNIQVETIESHNLRLKNTDVVLKKLLKVTHKNWEIISEAFAQRQKKLRKKTKQLKKMAADHSGTKEELTKAIEKQTELQNSLNARIAMDRTAIQESIDKIIPPLSSIKGKDLRNTVARLSNALEASLNEIDKLRAENISLKEIIKSLQKTNEIERDDIEDLEEIILELNCS